MPAVSRLSIAPVRSLGLLHPEEIDVTERGVAEDRRFFVIDGANRLVDQLTAARMVQVTSWTDPEATVLRLTFPDGRVIEGEVALGEHVETPIHGRTGVGHVIEGPWAAALSEFLGRDVRIVRCRSSPGGTRTGNPTSIISDGSLRQLAMHADVPDVDGRRFRMLIELDGLPSRTRRTPGSDGTWRWVGRRCGSRCRTPGAR